MSTRPFSFGRVLAAAALAVVAGSTHAGSGTIDRPATVVVQRYYPEVRLRKLHLVRPDLIPYPIDFDVYC